MFINCSCGSWSPIPMGISLEMGALNYSVPCTTSGYGGFGCRPQLGQNATLVELHFYHQSQNRIKLQKPILMCCQCDFNGLIHVTYTYNCCCWGFESCFNISSSIRSSRIQVENWGSNFCAKSLFLMIVLNTLLDKQRFALTNYVFDFCVAMGLHT